MPTSNGNRAQRNEYAAGTDNLRGRPGDFIMIRHKDENPANGCKTGDVNPILIASALFMTLVEFVFPGVVLDADFAAVGAV